MQEELNTMATLPSPLPDNFDELERIINRHEQQAQPLKKDAGARIYWHKGKKSKTPYALVYLHGFKGSHPEGYPVHQTIADSLGCNLYLSRLHGHGQVRVNKFEDLTPEKLIQSAKNAFQIGQKIGKKVILMGCSTGGLLACHLAAQSVHKSAIAALVLYSPLFHLYGYHSLLLENSCARRLLKWMPGRQHLIRSADPFSPEEENIWYPSYQLNGALALGATIQQLVKPSMFKSISCPAFIGYWYKNKNAHDRVVSTAAIKRTAQMLGTPPSRRMIKNFAHANTHVICNSLLSNAVQDVISETSIFLADQLTLNTSPTLQSP